MPDNAEFSKGMRWKGTQIHADDIVRLRVRLRVRERERERERERLPD